MPRPRVLALIQAGGVGGRLDVLTRERAKPALPFAGVHQLVDFPLSNLAHSGISDVWLSLQYQGSTLQEQVANGRPWDLDRNLGGLRILLPHEGTGGMDEEGFARGNADELFRFRDELASFEPDVVLVMSADHVYRLDYHDVLETHRDRDAECTVVVVESPEGDDPGDHGVVHVDEGRITAFDYKPDDPDGSTIVAEVIAYDPTVLREVLEELHRELNADAEISAAEGDTGLGDFGDHLLPRLVERGRTYAHRYDGYWRDVGQPHHYLRAHREVLTDDRDVLSVPSWPILSRLPQRVPARVLDGAEVGDSLLSPGCRVAGVVRRSVLGPGVVVEAGAEVHDSVLLSDTVVRAGARVHWSVVDADCEVAANARLGDPDASQALDDPDLVTLVGRGSRVVGAHPSGSRFEPGSMAAAGASSR
ncbi:MAG TPA: sugar phosphate nucleotidyltransferase [Nocardioides sp.]|mgnify:FL=1|uniref:glucose-1-phosphate adenylyltransferase family protein n=1 Tax=uncultured Nocardioides sp. TaxID=198441 RepID=UPI000EC6AC04|nr:sugar phosphate nucleotidyltransferase [uncultured Nocardioides sp.]HCB05751.1 glucose-1-phosphate adenylyltransferase [Nocardioides sp.]HRD62451.1 sugar phosphate nucleotidyltransferase [Nocardioides sp.]HRI95621.1 sugar phosphate nucleotidyltransferase [Nocardioides sp.]